MFQVILFIAAVFGLEVSILSDFEEPLKIFENIFFLWSHVILYQTLYHAKGMK